VPLFALPGPAKPLAPMIRTMVFLPQPPIIVGDTAGAAVHELDDLRSHCCAAIAAAVGEGSDLALMGSAPGIGVGRWLVSLACGQVPLSEVVVAPDTSPQRCQELGSQLAEQALTATALLVMGDGSACRSERAPGYLDSRAIEFDQRVAAALAAADTAALAELSPQLAAELLVAGRAPWQVAAAAAAATRTERGWSGELLTSQDPYGVSYFVALWKTRP